MGTYVKTFVVDGEEYELYAWTHDDETTSYDLLKGSEVIWTRLIRLPDDETVIGLVRAVRERDGEGGA
jgi:hypothetical protein